MSAPQAPVYNLFSRAILSPAPLPAPLSTASKPAITIIESSLDPVPGMQRAAGEPFAYLRDADGSVRLEWMDAVRFRVAANGSEIVFDAHEKHRALVFDYLLVQVLSVALLQQGVESLHGTAITLDGRTIGFVGDCGFGKSTLAAAFVKAGARLLSDDLLVLERARDRYLVLPGAQRLKLNADSAAATIGTARTGTRIADSGKTIYPLNDDEYEAEPCPLDALYVLRPRSGMNSREAVSDADGMRELLAATFNPLDTRPERLKSQLEFYRDVIGAVPIGSLRVAWNLADVPTFGFIDDG